MRGTVQGVGFRPFVRRLADRHGLAGWVLNRSGDVEIEVEGPPTSLDSFLHSLTAESPPLARIETVSSVETKPMGGSCFNIRDSFSVPGESQPVPPDVAPCEDCLRELFHPEDRRYRHPFINCTNCGPRFTLIQGVPYDRERTTMAEFAMCAACRAEYNDPEDRRYHAQPNACPECGPRMALLDAEGQRLEVMDPVAGAAAKLREGAIVAVKGLGGYHLAADAGNEAAVECLRARKHREEKPFALMSRDIDTVRAFCEVNGMEERLLSSPQRPIVLLRRRMGEFRSYGQDPVEIAEAVAPGNCYLGVMLPYTPLHHLLLEAFADGDGAPRALVMTSGNVSDEPIVYRDGDALDRLGRIADLFLIHDRKIEARCDDSVVRVTGGREMPIRRSRGYAPQPILLAIEFSEPVLACGAHLKNAFCIGQ
ncbi:MAG: carbamoyltransferase HypF, partial [Armatimonadetes bacterium]|nr:carbamoyltransferase HypF [Armatimonadota bacterium]